MEQMADGRCEFLVTLKQDNSTAPSAQVHVALSRASPLTAALTGEDT